VISERLPDGPHTPAIPFATGRPLMQLYEISGAETHQFEVIICLVHLCSNLQCHFFNANVRRTEYACISLRYMIPISDNLDLCMITCFKCPRNLSNSCDFQTICHTTQEQRLMERLRRFNEIINAVMISSNLAPVSKK